MRTTALATTLAVTLTLAAAGPAAAAPQPGGAACASIVHVGDSLSVGLSEGSVLKSGESIESKYKDAGIDGSKIRVEALSGRHITGGKEPGEGVVRSILDSAPEEQGRCWVIALGTNDVGGISTSADAGTRIDKIMDQIPADESTLWVEVASSDAAAAAFAPANMEKFNSALRGAAEKRGNLQVAPWSGEVDASMFTDGIHLTKDGYAQLAAFIASNLPAAPGPSNTPGDAPAAPSLEGRTIRLTVDPADPGSASKVGKIQKVLEAAGATVTVTEAESTGSAPAASTD